MLVARAVKLDQWGSLTVYEHDEEPPDGLHGADDFWLGDERRHPAQLLTTSLCVTAFVAVWPTDQPPPPDGPLTRQDLDGVALTSPVTHHRCFMCSASVVGLFFDGGSDFFRAWEHKHDWLRSCPVCGADVTSSRLSGMLSMPEVEQKN